MVETCESCRFWRPSRFANVQGFTPGKCCIRRPSIGADGIGQWPVLRDPCGCGEHQPIHPKAEAGVNAELLAALKQIAAIENNYEGGDWDEIEEARQISSAAILKAESSHD